MMCRPVEIPSIQVGALQMAEYLPFLENKKVGLVVNQTSVVGEMHLADTLLTRGITITKVFAPEHGFRGQADAGEKVRDGVDTKTGLPIISLYGSNKKPTPAQLEGIEVVVFDIQDVGTRFYTYISTMHYVMEACAENRIPVIILDRPNPNGMYVDGPVLDLSVSSFVGLHPIPILHGLTVGELAMMINEEGWLKGKLKCDLTVIKNKNYDHTYRYSLPVKPSPNLPDDLSIALYPTLCLFEGTEISVGRGTYEPFQQIGHPNLKGMSHEFIPRRIDGMSKYPPHENEICYGIKFDRKPYSSGFTLQYLIDFHEAYEGEKPYFNNFFEKLAGSKKLARQIKDGYSEREIRRTWQPELDNYKALRKKYLLYEDF